MSVPVLVITAVLDCSQLHSTEGGNEKEYWMPESTGSFSLKSTATGKQAVPHSSVFSFAGSVISLP